VIPLVLFGVAAVLGVSAGLDGRHDGRTVLAVVAIVLAIVAWWKAEQAHTRAELEATEEEIRDHR
jgi:hypothetical protein